MARKPSGKKQSSPDAIEDAEGNVDKIRQILFGGQMRDYEQRFEAMETRITQNLDRVSRELEQRLERLNTYTRREVDKLGEQIKAEKKDRTADGKKAGADIQNLIEQVESWFAEVDEQLASEGKELRQELLDQSNELSTQIRATHDQVSAELQKEADELADKKLDREDMAALLTEVAMRLGKDFKLPKG